MKLHKADKNHDWLKDKPNKALFITSLITALITILALCFTIYFSSKNVILAQNQLIFSKQLHTEDSTNKTKEEVITSQRNFIQDSLEKKQIEISKVQSDVSYQQAIATIKQYKMQAALTKQREEQEKPMLSIAYFLLDTDKIKVFWDNRKERYTVLHHSHLYIENHGIRGVTVNSARVCVWNRRLNFLSQQYSEVNQFLRTDDIDLPVDVISEVWNDKNTMFFVELKYIDIDKEHVFKYFCTLSTKPPGMHTIILGNDSIEFKKKLPPYNKSMTIFPKI